MRISKQKCAFFIFVLFTVFMFSIGYFPYFRDVIFVTSGYLPQSARNISTWELWRMRLSQMSDTPQEMTPEFPVCGFHLGNKTETKFVNQSDRGQGPDGNWDLAVQNFKIDKLKLKIHERFKPVMTGEEKRTLMHLYQIMAEALESVGVEHFLVGGSLLGLYRHQGIIPWDDDLDVAISVLEWEKVRNALACIPGYKLYSEAKAHWKFYQLKKTTTRSSMHTEGGPFPFVDIFFYFENENYVWASMSYLMKSVLFPRADVFPLTTAIFEGLKVPVPCDIKAVLRRTFQQLDQCVKAESLKTFFCGLAAQLTNTMSSSSDEQVLDLCEEIWKWRLQESPELATFCGFYQYDDSWDDISSEAYLKREACVRTFLKRAKAMDVASCSKDVTLSHSLLVEDLKLYLKGAEFKSMLMPINFLEGIHVDCNQTISFMKFESEEDFDMYIKRLQALPKRILQVIDILKQGVEECVIPFACSIQRIPEQIDSVLTSSNIEELELLKPVTEAKSNIPQAKMSSLQRTAKDIVTSEIFPAFEKLKQYVQEEYLGKCRPKEGINTLNNGDAWYQQCLNFHLSCTMSPQEVHDIGLKEVARIKARILELAQKEGLGDNTADIAKNLRERQHGSFKTKEEVISYVKDLCFKRIRPKISQLFKDLPDIEMKIEASPSYMTNAPAGYYLNGTPDGSRDGSFRVNNNVLDECFPSEYPALCLHEGEPGHHLQGIYSLAASHLPDFRRYCEDSKYYLSPVKFSFNTAYVEGWGLYSEALGEELGVYESSFEMLGRYSMEAFRACRLVVDTGLHAFGWSREQAIQYMIDNCLASLTEVTNEVERYITWPGQACAYKIGELKIWELRRKAEKELGDVFNIKEFHHCILSCGAVPLDVLASVVDQLIEDSKKKDHQAGNLTQ